MYFEFHKLVYPILPRVIFKADLLWSESNPEFRPIRIRNYKYYINIRLENHQNFLVDLSKFANNTALSCFKLWSGIRSLIECIQDFSLAQRAAAFKILLAHVKFSMAVAIGHPVISNLEDNKYCFLHFQLIKYFIRQHFSKLRTAYPSEAPEFTPRFLGGFMLLDLQFSVQCFVDRCLSFWPLCYVVYHSLIYRF